MSEPGTAAGYDAIAAEYVRHVAGELAHKAFDRDFLQRLAAQAPPGPVLDIGCGPGHVGRFVAELGRDVTGIDLSPAMVTQARALNPDMQFEVADLRALPFADAHFAALLAFYSVIHLQPEDLPAAFAEMHRVLAPNGRLAVSFHIGQEVRHIEELWGVKTRLDFVFFEVAQVQAALRAAGFSIVECLIRAPYAEGIEAQTQRAYLVAMR